MYEGFDLDTFTNIKEADSFRSINLVSTGAQHINVVFIHIDRYLAKCLNCICMEQDAMFFGNTSNFFDWLNGSDLIVCKHYRNKDGFRCDCFFQFIQTDNSILIHIKICDLCSSFFFQIFTCMQNSMMLDLGCNNVITFGFVCFKGSLKCPVVCLTSTCCKINIFFSGIQCICNLLSSFCYSLFALLCKIIDTGRISIIFRKIRKHCIKNFRSSFGCCCVIQIY